MPNILCVYFCKMLRFLRNLAKKKRKFCAYKHKKIKDKNEKKMQKKIVKKFLHFAGNPL